VSDHSSTALCRELQEEGGKKVFLPPDAAEALRLFVAVNGDGLKYAAAAAAAAGGASEGGASGSVVKGSY